jgi:predicted dehydrogenase
MSTRRIGVIGAGRIAQRHAGLLRPMQESGRVEVVGVADISLPSAVRMAQSFACPAYESGRELLEKCGADLVLVATPPAHHAEDVCTALLRGVDVLCEKPLTTDEASLALIEAALGVGRARLWMAAKYRHAADVAAAMRIVRAGAIGLVKRAHVCFANRVDMSQRWHSDPKVSGGGVLMDNGPHAADLARLVLGDVSRVRARRGLGAHGLEVEETVDLSLQNRAGAQVDVHLSWAFAAPADVYFGIEGASGRVQLGWRAAQAWIPGQAAPERIGAGFDASQAMRAQWEELILLQPGQQPQTMTTLDALANVRVISSGYRALRHGDWEPVEDRSWPVARGLPMKTPPGGGVLAGMRGG